MRVALVLAVLAVPLAGCLTEGAEAPPAATPPAQDAAPAAPPPSTSRVPADGPYPDALAAARAWRPDATLRAVVGEEGPRVADGLAARWQYLFAGADDARTLALTMDAGGHVVARREEDARPGPAPTLDPVREGLLRSERLAQAFADDPAASMYAADPTTRARYTFAATEGGPTWVVSLLPDGAKADRTLVVDAVTWRIVGGAGATWDPPALRVVGIYGERDSPETDLARLDVLVEVFPGAHPQDVGTLVIRYSDGAHVRMLALEPGGFAAEWVRGDGDGGVMSPGDLVRLRFEAPAPLAPRTSVDLTLIPETGPAVDAAFRTPPTYGTATTVTLR